MTAQSHSALAALTRGRGLPPRSTAETGERADAGAAAHIRRAPAPALRSDPVPYVASLDELKDAGLRRMVEAATATTVGNPARQWAPGTRPPAPTPPAAADRPVTVRFDGEDQVAILRDLAATAADHAHDRGFADDAWELEAIIRLLAAAVARGRAA